MRVMMKANTAVIICLLAIICLPWIWNAVKFASCDFKSDFKCEVIHGTGVFIPPAAFITVWFKDDGE